MTADEFDRMLAGWLDAESRSGRPISGIERVLDESRRRRPRPGWLATAGSHWVGQPIDRATGKRVRLGGRLELGWPAIMVALTLVLAVVAGAVLIGQRTQPVPAARGGQLAYIQGGAVFLADADGANPVRVSRAPGSDESCDSALMEGRMWAPDGRHLAYRSGWSNGCSRVVHILDAEGSPTAAFPSGDGWRVEWSSDGSRIVSWGTTEGAMEIHRADGTLTSTLRLPADYCICGDRDPTWAPGGTSLLVRDLQIPLDGSPPRPLATNVGIAQVPVRDPSLSADGSQYAFATNGRLFMVRVDDPRGRRLLADEGPFSRPVLSPAGDRIAALSTHDQTYDADGNVVSAIEDLVVVDVARGRVMTLATGRENQGVEAIWPIQFSAVDGRILLRRVDAAGISSLWSIDPDGSNARLLVNDATWGDWQPPTP